MEMQLRINEYWSKRSDEFADARYQDLHSQKKEEWLSVIRSWLPDKKEIRALDLGTGAGFFAFLMQELGCTVTGIDYSEAMIDNAKKVMGKLGREGIVFRQMDAQKLDFEAESFDFIFSRNVTWTLPDPEQAYREMYRVLAPGGCILNFDANQNIPSFSRKILYSLHYLLQQLQITPLLFVLCKCYQEQEPPIQLLHS